MNNIVHYAFQNNKDDMGKEIINFNFVVNNQGFRYNYSPFDFFCFVCKNEHLEILFRIIEDTYFWKKDKIIFEPEFDQTPRQWLIATAGYIFCTINKIKSLELLCDKYNITKFDADKTHFFEVANKNNSEELFEFLINRYGRTVLVDYQYDGIYETSLYNLPNFNKHNENLLYTHNENLVYTQVSKSHHNNPNSNSNTNLSIDNKLYMELPNINSNDNSNKNLNKNQSFDNKLYIQLNNNK
jgi:hypothetical protein